MQKRRNIEDVNTSPLKSPSKTESLSPLREQSNKQIDLGNTKLPLKEILELFQSPVHRDQLRAVTATRRLLSQDDRPPVKLVINAGLVPTLVSKLEDRNRQMRYEACWALTNIASGTTQETLAVANSGAIPKLVNLLSEQDDDLVDQAVWALGNIAGDGAHLRDMVLNCGTVPGIMTHIRSDKPLNYLRNLTWMISNLCRNKPAPSLELIGPLLGKFCSIFTPLIKQKNRSIVWSPFPMSKLRLTRHGQLATLRIAVPTMSPPCALSIGLTA